MIAARPAPRSSLSVTHLVSARPPFSPAQRSDVRTGTFIPLTACKHTCGNHAAKEAYNLPNHQHACSKELVRTGEDVGDMQVVDAVHSMLPQGRAILAVWVALVRAAPVPVHAPVLHGHAKLHANAWQRAAPRQSSIQSQCSCIWMQMVGAE